MSIPLPQITDLEIRPLGDDRLLILFPYHPDNVTRIKAIPGRRWHGKEKAWSIPYTEKALSLLDRFFNQEPVQSFPRPEKRPGAISKKRWEPLTSEEQAFIAHVEDEMKLRGFSPRTRKSYRNHLLRFSRYFNQDPQALCEREIRVYLLHLVDQQQISHAYLNQTISAIKFLYNKVLRLHMVVEKIPRPKPGKKLPTVLSRHELLRIFTSIQNIKHRVLFMLAYSAGLRVSEVVRLKVADIDSDRGLIFIHQGKGRKDRYSPLSSVALEILRIYWQIHRPDHWLFPGARAGKHLSVRTAQAALSAARKKAGITKHCTMHTLRHYAE